MHPPHQSPSIPLAKRTALTSAIALICALAAAPLGYARGPVTAPAAPATTAASAARPTLLTNAPAAQLAGKYRPGIALADYWVSEKYDGVRARWDGQQLWTRGGERVTPPPGFTAGWPRVAMEGELWAGRGGFEHAQSTALRQQPDAAQWQRMRFMVFDLPAHGGTFDERLAAMQAALAKSPSTTIQAAPQRKVASDAGLQALLREVVKGGGEGLMLHRASAPYRAGRSDDLLKLKEHDDAEARVVAHLPGRGKYAGRLGALEVETPDGQRFRIGTGFTDADRANPPPVGSWVTYRYRGLHGKTGLPRFASFVRVRADEPRFRAGS